MMAGLLASLVRLGLFFVDVESEIALATTQARVMRLEQHRLETVLPEFDRRVAAVMRQGQA